MAPQEEAEMPLGGAAAGYGAAPLEDPDELDGKASVGSSTTWREWLQVLGPGLVVMLADTDVGSIVTAAQSGAEWGYHTLGLQLLLIPVLYITQKLTVRLGIITRRGHGELIRERYGSGWAWLSVSTLCVACVGGMISEISGIVAVGLIVGVPRQATGALVGVCLLVVAFTGSYRQVERVALCFGLFGCFFLVLMWMGQPQAGELFEGMVTPQLGDQDFLYLSAANVGAVIMPWMIFYQQSAVIDKNLKPHQLWLAEVDTAIGSVVTQFIMIAITVTTASTLWPSTAKLTSIRHISDAITPHIGVAGGRVLFALGVFGEACVAAIVVSLTAAWGLGEAAGYQRSLECSPKEAPWFYLVYTSVVCVGVGFNMFDLDTVQLNLNIQVMNCLLLPIVLGFLYMLSRTELPEEQRLRGWWGVFVGVLYLLLCIFGIVTGIWGVVYEKS